MECFAKEIKIIDIEDELKKSYLDYAMSVIVGRALPDICDGLKPVHRRILFAMYELGNYWNKPYKKSARVVGDVIGKYHPHGESAVYDAIVRMAQTFSLRYVLICGQGNFGSIDGDAAAAMRYTEIKMSKISSYLLNDLDKDTVNFIPNYDNSELQPIIFPSVVPNLLINGSSGIAVGMATNIPPHNLVEVINALIYIINNSYCNVVDLMKYVHGPDFPTGGILISNNEIFNAYETGKGKLTIRSKIIIENDNKNLKNKIIIHELPYQVNKLKLVEKIIELIKNKRLEGVSDLIDESNKNGMRIVIELRKHENVEKFIKDLYLYTNIQYYFNVNMVSIVNGCPKLLNLKNMMFYFINHRKQVISRRSIYELNKLKSRFHILEGLIVALYNIDYIINLIKNTKFILNIKKKLLIKSFDNSFMYKINNFYQKNDDQKYFFSEIQIVAILSLNLQSLLKLEINKLLIEYNDINEKMKIYNNILLDNYMIEEIIKLELLVIKKEFFDLRKTDIIHENELLYKEEILIKDKIVVTLSNAGYIKFQLLDLYKVQHRGGKGKMATIIKEEDFIINLFVATTHDMLLCFSNKGKVYNLKMSDLVIASRISRGKLIANLLSLDNGESISTILSVINFTSDQFVFMSTKKGMVKKVKINEFSNIRSNGIIAINLKDDDLLIGAEILKEDSDIMLFTNYGKAIRFNSSLIKCTSRLSMGVRGIKLNNFNYVISLIIIKSGGCILLATANGYGKRTDINEFKFVSRGGYGVIAIQISKRNGPLIGAVQVFDDDVMLISGQGLLVRIKSEGISKIKRNTQGMKLINLVSEEKLVAIKYIDCKT
ncbi:MAG: DNA gyrase subunit A [Candidatus Azosocius agrarius]|nr:MAG: DNA gyrase subunit A [Gammaproteobacteria bacterium]